MKLWDKGYTVDNLVEKFTVGDDRSLDLRLASYDVQGNLAHARMLYHVGLLNEAELHAIQYGLELIKAEIEAGTFTIGEEFEDVHSKIEFELVRKIGDAGKKIHTARSRNDQVLVDIHLFVKSELKGIKTQVATLFETLMALAEEHKDILMPGYTHTQIAMPSSFGLWFSAYAESLIDDLTILHAALQIADQNPLGSAAGYGSSFPIDRAMTTELLGFSVMKYNVIAAQMSRGRLEKSTAWALASVGTTLAKLSSDVCLYISQNFGFIGFPKELTTGSSIMPHKQNPDVFELIRAKCNQVQNLPAEISMMTTNLTSGYHRDFQLLKGSLIRSLDTIKECLEVSDFMLRHIEVNRTIMDDPKYDAIYSVEAVNTLVMEGMSFREAYQQVGQMIQNGTYRADKSLHHTHAGSLGNLCLDEIRKKFEHAL